MSDHPSRDELFAFLRGELPAEGVRALVRHLMRPCQECSAAATALARSLFATPKPGEEAAYDGAIERARRAARKRHRALRREQAEVEKVAPLLVGSGLVETGRKMPRRMGEVARLKLLLEQSWSLRHENPAEMLRLALMAVQQAKRLDPGRHGLERVFDLQGQAHAELGNACRLRDQHDLAEAAFTRARELLDLGSGDESLQVRLLDLEASLAADRRQFGLAAHFLLKVADFHRRTGDQHLVGRAIISRGLYVGYAGNPEEALRLLQEGLSLIDEVREPRLTYSAVHNQLLFITEMGRFREAQIFRLRNIRILAQDEGRINANGLRWIDGRIEAGLEKLVSAEGAFREAKLAYEELGLPFLASLTALDLAAVLIAQQRTQEAQEIVLAAAKVFQALRIEREALAAVIALCTAFAVGKATRGLAEDVADFLRRIERDPNARFEIRSL